MKQTPSRRWDLWIGLGGTFIVNFVLYWAIPPISVFLWILQWIYVVPAALILQKRGRVRMAQGIWIMAGVSVLLDLYFCGYGASRIH